MSYKPEDYGVVGAGDDTSAFNAALSAIRSAGRGTLRLASFDYIVGALNATGIASLEIEAESGCILQASVQGSSYPVLDLIQTRTRIIGDITIRGPDTETWTVPTAAVLVCNSDRSHFDGVKTTGKFSAGALCVIAASSVNVHGGQWINRHASGPCLNVSTNPDWGVNSAYGSFPPSPNVSDIYLHGTELHSVGGAQWTSYFRNADHVVFNGGIHDNSERAHMLFQGACKRITSIGQKFYSELGTPAQGIFECDTPEHSCAHLKVLNLQNDNNLPLTIGLGSFPYLWAA